MASTPRQDRGTPAGKGSSTAQGKRPRLTPQSATPGSASGALERSRFDLHPYDAALDEPSGKVVGRLPELQALRDFFVQRIVAAQGGHLYVCGRPGTGKTECVNHVVGGMRNWLRRAGSASDVSVVQLRATTFNGALKPAWGAIAQAFELTDATTGPQVQKALCARRPMRLHILVVDEIDQLHKDVLLGLFKTSTPESSLVVLGMANTIDTASKLLKDLAVPPPELPFSAYDYGTLMAIAYKHVDERFAVDGALRAAIELCARKEAASLGDARSIINVVKRAATSAGDQVVKAADVRAAMSKASLSGALKEQHDVVEGIGLPYKLCLVALSLVAGGSSGKLVGEKAVRQKLAELQNAWDFAVHMEDFDEWLETLEGYNLVERKPKKKELRCKLTAAELAPSLGQPLGSVVQGAKPERKYGANLYKPMET